MLPRGNANTFEVALQVTLQNVRFEMCYNSGPNSQAAVQIVDVLTRRLRLLTLPQISTTWFDGNEDHAQSVVDSLDQQALTERRDVLARPMLEMSAPAFSWRPGGETPEFGKLAYGLRCRWTEGVEPITILVATDNAKRRFGGACGGRWPRTAEISHDVSLAGVYLWYRNSKPKEAVLWAPEAQLLAEERGTWRRLPDAVIRRPDGIVQRVVEFGGSYRKQKLEAFHLEMSDYPYEIW